MRTIILGAGAAILAIAACAHDPKPKPVAPSPARPAAAATASPTPDNAVKTFNGRGVVTKIDLKLVSVELNHEEIKGVMPAMIMEFYVKEKTELEVLKVGDKVDFVLEDDRGQERIISIKKTN